MIFVHTQESVVGEEWPSHLVMSTTAAIIIAVNFLHDLTGDKCLDDKLKNKMLV